MKFKWIVLLAALCMFSSVGVLMAQDSTAASPLVGTTWQWESFASGAEAFDVTNPENYTITFNEDGSVNIQADCNSVRAQYTSEAEGSIAIMMGPSTLMACPEGSHDQVFTIALSQITMYSFMEDGRLLLEVPMDSGSLVFSAQAAEAAPSLVGTTWQWESFASGAEAFDVTNPENYTITFNEDGTVAIQADCNSVRAAYTSESEGSVIITMGPSTLMACPEGSHDQVFTLALSQVAIYSFMEDGRLLLEVPMDSGSLVFSAQAAEAAPSLVGTTWQWESFASGAEAFDVEDPQNYTITFKEDGSLVGRADCNNIIMQYVANDDGTISILPGISTLMACPEGSLDQQFNAALANVAVFSFTEDGGLLLEAQASSGSLLFSAQPQVTGTMSYLQRIALPDDVFIRVQIEDVSRMDVASVVIGEQIIMPAGAQIPIPFAVSYSPNVIQETNRYSVSVRITDPDGRLLWVSDTNNPVITGGNPTSGVEVNLAQVGS